MSACVLRAFLQRAAVMRQAAQQTISQTRAFPQSYTHIRGINTYANSLRAEEKVTVHFLNRDGKRITVKASIGESLLDVVVDRDLDIDGFGACEGTLACSTCHLIFEEDVYKKLGPVSDEEMDMLDLAYGLTDTSRLGCQVCLRKDLDGMILRVPDVISDARADSEKESSTAPPKI
ncbi:adrenodoxin [Danio rerio]|uniref:Adrenodoxin, mitochondrial n=1 Tax=Danio rerio TaxID=7955 RepID=E7F7J1_DANRE|nr:adrenodoxin [Danio rerio]XP_021334641.1 adrenodoxin [Danio rerio]|eukprot:XP_001922722.2 adrenodoxin [Danio rerio]